MAEFAVEVSYSQLAIFANSLDKPFNDWSARHVDQGFAWRPGSVSFRTLVENGRHLVEVSVVDFIGAVHPQAIRVIDVPFDVPPDGAIDVASIADAIPLVLSPGAYLLRCEFLPSSANGDQRAKLCFARKEEQRFDVVLADADLILDGELLKTAEPA